LKIGILASESSWYFRDIERAARALDVQCDRLDFSRLISSTFRDNRGDGDSTGADPQPNQDRSTEVIYSFRPDDAAQTLPPITLGAYYAIIVRTMPPGSLEQVVFRMDILGRLEQSGVKVVNSPKSLECAVDKYLTTARLQSAGLPVPRTVVCENEDDALQAFSGLGGDVVVKPLFGSEGRGIVRVSDRDLAFRTFRTLMRLNSVLYLQEFIDHRGFDVRILVLDGQALGGMRRRSDHDFRTNISRDAIAEPYTPNSVEIDYALRASAACGTKIAGIDLLYDRSGNCFVIEVNAVPGWQAFRRVTQVDVAAELLKSIFKK
jgi:ribosomal protein S6--L-glutamate ligase